MGSRKKAGKPTVDSEKAYNEKMAKIRYIKEKHGKGK